MNESVINIMLHLTDADYGSALLKIIETLKPNNTALRFVQVLGNYKNQLRDLADGLIDTAQFNTQKAGITVSIRINLETLSAGELAKIHTALTGNENVTEKKQLVLLFVAASPTDQDQIKPEKDFQTIKNQLLLSAGKSQLTTATPLYGTSFAEFSNNLIAQKPDMIHFSGHGSQLNLFFEDEYNLTQVISASTLKALLSRQPDVQFVFLNACRTRETALLLSQLNIYVMGYDANIADPTSQRFLTAFYSALAHGEPYKSAYEVARLVAKTEQVPASAIPSLFYKNEKIN